MVLREKGLHFLTHEATLNFFEYENIMGQDLLGQFSCQLEIEKFGPSFHTNYPVNNRIKNE